MLYEKMMFSPTSQLSEFVSGIEVQSLPEAVRILVCQHLLDVIAGIFASADIPEAISIRRLLGNNDPEVVGKIAMMAHAAESDPIHAGTTVCAGLIAVPPAILLSQNGETAMAAIVAGYETAIRIGEALGSAQLLGQGWWPSAVLGGAGAAVATARALGLNVTETRNALSLALIQTGGLGTGAPEAPESRNLLAAHCVRTGVSAAQAAAIGITGPAEPLTGDRGFLAAFGNEPSPERLLVGLGEGWKIADTCLKAFPCALQAQSALVALQEIMDAEKLSADAIQAIEFGLPEAMNRIVDRPALPASRFAAAASLQFLAAALLLDGDIVPTRMEAGARAQDEVINLMGKIAVTHAADLDAAYPATWPAHVRVSTASGEYTALVHLPAGHPERALTLPVTINRFRTYSVKHLDHTTQNALIEAVMNLADLSDMTAITAPIRALL